MNLVGVVLFSGLVLACTVIAVIGLFFLLNEIGAYQFGLDYS